MEIPDKIFLNLDFFKLPTQVVQLLYNSENCNIERI